MRGFFYYWLGVPAERLYTSIETIRRRQAVRSIFCAETGRKRMPLPSFTQGSGV